jgi:hypothetical protein
VSNLVYYAMGGGLGHLVRARAVLYTLGHTGPVTLISASEHARDARVVGDWNVALVPSCLERDPPAFARWIDASLTAAGAERLCVDAFPAGILGELSACSGLGGLELWHVARRLRWSQYSARSHWALQFDRRYVLEPLEAEHETFLRAHSRVLEPLCLCDPPVAGSAPPPLTAAAHWLVVHSGPVAEVEQILAYAAEARARQRAEVELWVLTPQALARLPAATHVRNVYPAQRYFAAAGHIFSAAGFNVMRQCAPYRFKHTVLPMPRRYDDQFERARRARCDR